VPADPRLRADRLAYEAQGRKLGGYLARPAEPGKYPAVNSQKGGHNTFR
jgi:hypothetical protein